MSMDKKNTMSAVELLAALFDGGVYTELGGKLYSQDTPAEAVAACGKVSGQTLYAFAQAEDRCGGAMSVAQANKLKKLYDLALKTGCPVVGFYFDSTARISQGNMLLDAVGDVLSASGRLSGVVPQISVVLGSCVSTTAMMASNADFVIMTEDAKLSLCTDSECTGKGRAALVTKTAAEAVEAVKTLVDLLPSNNLGVAPLADDIVEDSECIFDKDTVMELYTGMGEGSKVALARLGGQVVGAVKTLGTAIGHKDSKKIASFVRFCDAFSIPVVTLVDATEFECLSGAKSVLSAYAEATTPKVSVVTGKAVGAVYMSMAGKGCRADATLALDGAVVSPIRPEAAAYIALGDSLTGTVAQQDKLIDEYVKAELSADNAAKAGYIDDVVSFAQLRDKLISYMDILSGKRETSLPKKHNTI